MRERLADVPEPIAMSLPFDGRWLVQISPARRVPSEDHSRVRRLQVQADSGQPRADASGTGVAAPLSDRTDTVTPGDESPYRTGRPSR